MPAKIKRAELVKLQQKLTLYNMTISPKNPRGDLRLLANTQSYAKVLLYRHGAKDCQINPQTGAIVPRAKGEDKVQAEIEQHL